MKPSERSYELLQHVGRGDVAKYNGFIRTLIFTGQYDVVTTLQEDPSQFCAAVSSVYGSDSKHSSY